MRDTGAEQAQADQAVLRFQLAERFLQILFALPELDDGGVARAHDVADFVARDEGFVDELAIMVAALRGLIGFQHELQRAIDVQRHDGGFKHQHRQNIDGAEHDEQVGFGVIGKVRVKREVDADGEDQEEYVVQHHQLQAHFEIAEEPGDAFGRPHGRRDAEGLCSGHGRVPVLYDSTLARWGLGMGGLGVWRRRGLPRSRGARNLRWNLLDQSLSKLCSVIPVYFRRGRAHRALRFL